MSFDVRLAVSLDSYQEAVGEVVVSLRHETSTHDI